MEPTGNPFNDRAPWPAPTPVQPSVAEAASLALAVQDACNLSAVLATWARLRPSYNSPAPAAAHPLDILFLSKVSSLMVADASAIGSVGIDGADAFALAYEWAKSVTGEGK